VYQQMGRLDEAGPLFRQAVEIHQSALGAEHPNTLRVRHSEALYHQAKGDFRSAEQTLTEVRDRLSELLGPNGPALVQVLGDLARLYTAAGDHLAAEPLWRRIIEIHRAPFAPHLIPPAPA